ncbi:hypothetical protein PSSHI_34480 [Photobacterium sp. R1]
MAWATSGRANQYQNAVIVDDVTVFTWVVVAFASCFAIKIAFALASQAPTPYNRAVYFLPAV